MPTTVEYLSVALTELVVDGKTLPTPALAGVTIKREKIWTDATGRAESGLMNGDIKAIKDTISVKWPPLTFAQVAIIESVASAVGKSFVAVSYCTMTGVRKTIQAYFGTPTYTIYSWGGRLLARDAAVDIVER